MVPTANVLVTLTVGMLADNETMLAFVSVAVVIVPVVIVATLATKAAVTFALLKVVLPVTDNVLAIDAEPLTNKSSKPIASSNCYSFV